MLLVHGIGEHSGRYEHVGAAFAAAGIDGFMTQMQRLQERAMPETSNERAFIQAWWDQHQGNEVSSSHS